MDKKTLMIGDWVYNTHNRQNEQVQEIGSGLIMLNYNDLYECDEIEPIPLTPEILEKNGFEQLEEDSYICKKSDKEDDYSIVVDLLVPYLSYIRKDKMPKASYGGEIKCVHQLQHALRLCGILKEIEL